MGAFSTTGLEEVAEYLLHKNVEAERVIPEMLEAGAAVIVKAQQEEAAAMGIKDTEGFIKSIKATKVKGSDTERHIEVYPQGKAKHGNDRKGDKSNVRYATIGFIAQYGTSKTPARPYMTSANEKAHEAAYHAMYEIWEKV